MKSLIKQYQLKKLVEQYNAGKITLAFFTEQVNELVHTALTTNDDTINQFDTMDSTKYHILLSKYMQYIHDVCDTDYVLTGKQYVSTVQFSSEEWNLLKKISLFLESQIKKSS